MLVTVIALKYALLVSQWSCGHFRKLTDSIVCEQLHKSSRFDSTDHAKLYPAQHGDRIVVTMDSVTSLQPIYSSWSRGKAQYTPAVTSQPVLLYSEVVGATSSRGFLQVWQLGPTSIHSHECARDVDASCRQRTAGVAVYIVQSLRESPCAKSARSFSSL